MALVTIEGTRARRVEEELTHSDPSAKSALEALVRGRLLVARDTPEGTAYEVAHEALIKGWDSLRKWLDEHQEARAVKQRLETSTSEWLRIGRAKEALWGARQLAELGLLEEAEIGPRERSFIEASRARETWKRQLRRALLVSIPVMLGLLYGTVQLAARRNLERKVNALVAQGAQILADARQRNLGVEQLRQQTFAAFDAKNRDKGEEIWKKAREAAVQADRKLAQAANTLESALALDSRRDDIRDRLAEALYERAVVSDRDRQDRLRDDLLARLAVYDVRGQWTTRWNAPGTLKLSTAPPGATAELLRYSLDTSSRWATGDARIVSLSSEQVLSLAPGSYLLTLTAPSRATVRYPLVISRGEILTSHLRLPRVDQVPASYVYVPPGRFLFGYGAEDQTRKMFFGTAPLHTVNTDEYLIGQNEVTYGEWIAYLNDLPAEERKKRTPRAGTAGLVGGLELREVAPRTWRLVIQPKGKEFSALEGERLLITARDRRAKLDWSRVPVGGISCDDATAYTKWLSATGRVPGARLCSEWEWERAARGADDRTFSHAEVLQPDDANYDETYGRQADTFGPDEAGSHTASRSPFGVDDLVGNHYEFATNVISNDSCVLRSGSYNQEVITNYLPNRNQVDGETRLMDAGLRVCAPLPK